MLLLDHFRPPLSVTHPCKGFHSAWANAITNGLNEVLPEGYYAIPEVPLGDQIEIDVATLESGEASLLAGGVATAVWAPPRPRLAAPVDFSHVHGVAVHVFQDQGGPQLRAAIELVLSGEQGPAAEPSHFCREMRRLPGAGRGSCRA
jgi:hypothetical protein